MQPLLYCAKCPRTDRQLVAYVVSNDPALKHDALAGFLAQYLPDYMVPSAWVSLDALPLSPNGKVDQRALPAPPSPNTARTTAPRTEQERTVAAVWQEVLGLAEMGVNDDFFALGGHSLLAMELIHHLQERLGLAVRVKLLFEQPTIAGLLAQLDKTPQLDRDARLMLETIRAEGKRPPLFYIGSTNNARQLAPALHKEQPVYGLNIFGTREATNPELPVEIAAIAAQFLAEMRKVQPHGPYQIAAYCADAYIAFEIGKQLQSVEEQIALFAIVDAIWHPGIKQRIFPPTVCWKMRNGYLPGCWHARPATSSDQKRLMSTPTISTRLHAEKGCADSNQL